MGIEPKAALLAAVLARLEQDTEALVASQKATQAGAVHSEARQEGSKDTRAIESGYLARGLAARAEELQRALARLRAVRPVAFGEEDPISVGALVTLESDDLQRHLYLLPVAGGLELTFEGRQVQVITPASPLGAALVGRGIDDTVTVDTPRGPRRWEIVDLA